jgi:phosphatidylinositol alpha-1,6-mannosyltransferase
MEAVDEGKTGYFVDEPTVPAISAALERYFKGDIRFDSADCQAFANRFTWARVVDHAMQFYAPGQ